MKKNIKENLMKNYQMFNLEENLFDSAIESSMNCAYTSYIDVFNHANRIIESYLIEKCKGDIEIQILLLEKYNNAKLVITKIHNLDSKIAMQIYELSFEYVINNYDSSKSIYSNLSKIMVRQIKEKVYGLKIEDEKVEEKTTIRNEEEKSETEKEKIKSKVKTKKKTKIQNNNKIAEVEPIKIEESLKQISETKNNEFKETTLNKIKEYINNKQFFELLKGKIENENKYLIAQLLFGYYGKYYEIKSISKFLNVSENEILQIYIEVLQIYNRMFYELYNNEMKLEYKND